MNFSINNKLRRVLSLALVVVMMMTLFAGCKKDDSTQDTTEPNLNLNLPGSSEPSETQTEPPETTEPEVINENTATVTSQLNIRSSPSTEATVVGTLFAGDKVEISRRESVTGIDWAYIISPEAGWIVMDFVEMDIPTEDEPKEDTSTPAGSNEGNTAPEDTSTNNTANNTANNSSIKGVVSTGLYIRSEPSTNGTIQGNYTKGDTITILEVKNGWGRTNKGWVKMDYVTTSGTATNNTTTNNNNTTNTTTNVTGNGNTTVVLKGIVRVNELNIRANSSTDSDRVGMYNYGDRVEVLEKSGSWGRTKKGWIHLDYVYQDGTTGSKTANGTVTGSQLNIRSGPGTGYASVGSYNSGDIVTILEQFTYDGVTWGCTNKGWISMDYVSTNGTTNNNTSSTTTGTITANGLRIRSGPGTDYNVVGSLNYGDRVNVTSQQTVDGVTWGNISQGWISMQYVSMD